MNILELCIEHKPISEKAEQHRSWYLYIVDDLDDDVLSVHRSTGTGLGVVRI
jgi:hypothetical protein